LQNLNVRKLALAYNLFVILPSHSGLLFGFSLCQQDVVQRLNSNNLLSASRFTALGCRGATTSETLRGTMHGLGPNTGRLRPAPGQRPGWGWVREGVAPSRCGGPGVLPPKFFSKTQMLNPDSGDYCVH